MAAPLPPPPPPPPPHFDASKRTSTSSQTPTTPTKTFWQKTKSGSKASFDRLWGYADKLGQPVNRLSNKLGSEAFWPSGIEQESEKAARILRSFCTDGFYDEEKLKSPTGPQQKQKVLKKIPAEVIKNAKGLAIFTTMRAGLWVSGAGGSGVLVARQEDGEWSPPCGILLHTAGLGFLIGVDIYDCVLVLNTDKAVQAFSKWRCTLGGEISATAGPVGMGGILDTEVHARQAPIFTYLKSRGFYASVQMDGTVIIERSDENEKFYGQKISAKDILAGKAQSRVMELRILMETLKAAQGDTTFDRSLVPSEPPPADFEVVEDGHVFGVPDSEDPDPYGLLALEKEGMVLKEAGSKQVASHDEFEFKPALTSPVYSVFKKTYDSQSSSGRRDSWRGSTSTVNTFADRPKYASQDMSTQTEFEFVPSPTKRTTVRSITEEDLLPSPPLGSAGIEVDHIERLPEGTVPSKHGGESTASPKDEEAETDDEADDAPAIQEVHQHVQQAPKFIVKPKMVAVAKRVPPPLPPRNPGRMPSGRNTPDNRSIAEPAGSAAGTPSVEKEDELANAKVDVATEDAEAGQQATRTTTDNAAATQTDGSSSPNHALHTESEEHDTQGHVDTDDDDDEYDEFDEAEEEIQVVTAVSAAKVASIRQVNPGASGVTTTTMTPKTPTVLERAQKLEGSSTSTHDDVKSDTAKAASITNENVSGTHTNGTASGAAEKAASEVLQAKESSTAMTNGDKTDKDEATEKVDELPGVFHDENTLPAPIPAIPPRSSARASSKSPAVSPARSPARSQSQSKKPNHRVSMFGIRDSLHAANDDDDDDDEDDKKDDAERKGRSRNGVMTNGKHEEDDFS